MAYEDLHDFLERLERIDELHRVKVEVDPLMEIAEITDRVCKSPGGKALLFENVRGSRLPVATNLFGSMRRTCLSLEIEAPQELTRRMEKLLRECGAHLSTDLLSRFAPFAVDEARCHDVVDLHPDMDSLPALKNWPGDGAPDNSGRFLTLPLVFTRDPESGRFNCGMYRVELFDKSACGIHWHRESGGATHYEKQAALGGRMPVAIVLGSDPAVIITAMMPLPEDLDEMHFAGFLRGSSVEMVRCRTNDLMVPANAELVIEGYIEPGDVRQGGAFGNHTGFYVPAGPVPVVTVSCITRRRDAVFPATVVGRPPMEDCYMAKAVERLMLPISRSAIPEITDISLPLEGIFHGAALVAIKKTCPGQARHVMESLWSGGWLARSRLLIIVDADVNPHDISRSAWRVLNNVDWRRDFVTAGGDAPSAGPFGGRLGIDATRKLSTEMDGYVSAETGARTSVLDIVDSRWRDYGL